MKKRRARVPDNGGGKVGVKLGGANAGKQVARCARSSGRSRPRKRPKIPVLLAVHDVDVAEALALSMADVFAVRVVHTLAAVLKLAGAKEWFDVVAVDSRLPDGSGFAGVRELRRRLPAIHAAVFAEPRDEESADRAADVAVALILKNDDARRVEKRFAAFLHDLLVAEWLDGSLRLAVLQAIRRDRVTFRETQVGAMLMNGMSRRRAAGRLGLHVGTVDNFTTRLKDKCDIDMQLKRFRENLERQSEPPPPPPQQR